MAAKHDKTADEIQQAACAIVVDVNTRCGGRAIHALVAAELAVQTLRRIAFDGGIPDDALAEAVDPAVLKKWADHIVDSGCVAVHRVSKEPP